MPEYWYGSPASDARAGCVRSRRRLVSALRVDEAAVTLNSVALRPGPLPCCLLFADRLADLRLHRQLVRPVSEGHERAAKGLAIDGASNLDETVVPEVLGRTGHHDVGVAAFGAAPCSSALNCLFRIVIGPPVDQRSRNGAYATENSHSGGVGENPGEARLVEAVRMALSLWHAGSTTLVGSRHPTSSDCDATRVLDTASPVPLGIAPRLAVGRPDPSATSL